VPRPARDRQGRRSSAPTPCLSRVRPPGGATPPPGGP